MVGTSTTNNNALNHTSATTTPKPSIPSLEETTSYIDFPSNHWGYYAVPMNKANTINNTNNNNNNNGGSTNTDNTNTINPTAPETDYSPLPLPIGLDPDDPTKTGHKINEKDRMATNDTTNVNFATKIDTGQPSGTYNNTVLYTAITNAPPQPITYSVHYDKNGGQNVPQDQEYSTLNPTETSHEFQLTDINKDTDPDKVPFRPGYTFGGWTAVQPDPDKNINNQAGAYSPGSQIYLTNAKPEVTLYAIWIPNEEIGFNGSGITTMQQMTPEICNAAPVTEPAVTGRLQDTRDYKVYYVTKLKDNRCWMTQNLSLDIRADSGYTYTSADTNVDPNNPWRPGESASKSKSTIPNGKLNSDTWATPTDYIHPYSYNPGDSYFQPAVPLTVEDEQETDFGDAHYAAGNYYNWSAAKASNNTSGQTSAAKSTPYNICPKGWTLPTYNSNEFGKMLYAQKITTGAATNKYANNGFNLIRSNPVYWVCAGVVSSSAQLVDLGSFGYYVMGATQSTTVASRVTFGPAVIKLKDGTNRAGGNTVRCLARTDNINPPTPSPTPIPSNNNGAEETTNDSTNTTYNPASINRINNATTTNDAISNDTNSSYSNPQGVDQYGRPLSTTTSGPNWFLFILLLVLSLLTLGVVLYLFYKKHKRTQST